MTSRTALAGTLALAAVVAVVAGSELLSARSPGRITYEATCASCHDVGAHGAPRAGHALDWAPRIARGREDLYEVAMKGKTAGDRIMPPRGGDARLTDEQVRQAVDYLVDHAPAP